MKKFLSVLVAITMCMCLFVPMVSATDDVEYVAETEETTVEVTEEETTEETTSSLGDLLGGIDISEYSVDSLASMIVDFNLEDLDFSALLDSDTAAALQEAIASLTGTSTDDSSDTTTVTSFSMTDIMNTIISLFTTGDASSLTDALSSLTSGDTSDLMSVVSSALSLDLGIELGTLSSIDLGSFDIMSLDSSVVTDTMATAVDTLLSGLTMLGIDTEVVEGLLDNELVNFFANLYIGYVGGSADEEVTTTEAETTTAAIVDTTDVPVTGDTSSVVVAIATLSVSAAAAYVCLKKKED